MEKDLLRMEKNLQIEKLKKENQLLKDYLDMVEVPSKWGLSTEEAETEEEREEKIKWGLSPKEKWEEPSEEEVGKWGEPEGN